MTNGWEWIIEHVLLPVGIFSLVALLCVGISYWLQLHLYLYVWVLKLARSPVRFKIKYNVPVPLSDGVTLLADLYIPKKGKKFPSIILRTPYGKGNPEHSYATMATILCCQGYVVVLQDVRGKYGSEGVYHPFINEEKDGKETVEWVAKQAWSDGKTAVFGFSYLGTCAWLTAPKAPKALTTIVPMFSCQNAYTGWMDRGVPYLKDILYWLSKHHGRHGRMITHEEVDNIILQLPVLQFDKRLKDGIDTFKTWMSHVQEDEYWRSFSVSHRREQVEVPALFVGGWFDRFLNNTMNDFNRTIEANPNALTAKSCLIVGPWAHQPGVIFSEMDFGKGARFQDLLHQMVDWLDLWMKEVKPRFDLDKPVTYFMMGKNQWRKTTKWPPPGVNELKFYLESKGAANTAAGDGALVATLPEVLKTDHYVYDPENPAPSIGNRMLYGNDSEGPKEQSAVTARPDVLVYKTAPLEQDVEIAGPSYLILYVTSSAIDTDFCAKMCDVHPDGKAYFLMLGFVRMRFMDSVRATHGVEGDKVYRLEVHLGHIAHCFMKGHRIQIQVTSSDFPNHERNLNTGGSNERDSEEVKAHQTIFHGGRYDSHLQLPVLEVRDNF